MSDTPAAGPLAGIRVLDLSRILAGPTCTQLLGDYGADVIKIERPGEGDDTRKWGPPYVTDAEGANTTESAYYLSSNRNKRSVSIDISKPEGAALVKRLAAGCDVMIENFKVGGLKRYGLDHETVRRDLPGLVYCSITGFGQTGPNASRPGYDFLAQGMGGIMSLTGDPHGEPTKVGIAIADVMCGMYATTAILAALRHRDRTGEGQHIDIGLADTQVAWLVNEGLNYLTSGRLPVRRGNAHANIVPYQVFATSDSHIILAVGNDGQFARFCAFIGRPDLADDPAYATNPARVANREALVTIVGDALSLMTKAEALAGLEAHGVPAGPVNNIAEVFDDPQFVERGMRIRMPHEAAGSGEVELIGNPVKMSATPVTYRHAPPMLGRHTDEVLHEMLGMGDGEIAALREGGIV